MARGGGGDVRLLTSPLLPTREDRDLAREVEEVAAEHFPPRWVRLSNELGVVRTTRWPVTEMLAFAVTGGIWLPLTCRLWWWPEGSVWGAGLAAALWVGLAVGGAVAGALMAAVLGGFGAAGRYRRGRALLSVGSGRGGRRRAAILHELCHRMQEVVPGLTERERAFLEERLGRPVRAFSPPVAFVARLVSAPWGVFRGGGGRTGGFYHPYAGTDPMDGHAYEVFSMGLQGMCYDGGDTDGELDGETATPFEDHQEFVRRCLREL